jgi:NADH-quinone oxidoreductase subunit M
MNLELHVAEALLLLAILVYGVGAWRVGCGEGGEAGRLEAIGWNVGASIAVGMALQLAGQNQAAVAAQAWLFVIDRLGALPLALHAGLALATLALLPRQSATGPALSGLLQMSVGMVMAYAAVNPLLGAAGWWIAVLPFLRGHFSRRRQADRGRSLYLLTGTLAYTAAVILDAALGDGHASSLVGALVVVAVAFHKGLVPANMGLLRACETESLLPMTLFYNGHLGALVLLRSTTLHQLELPGFVMPVLGILALITAVYVALLAITQRRPRQVLALIMSSQATFILAAIASGDPATALIYWGLVAIASTGLIGSYVAAEVRQPRAELGDGHLGLASRAPVLAVMFLVCGLALVGAPGTAGFWAEDLLLHAAIQQSLLLPTALLFATALNAIQILRLYCQIFLGAGLHEVSEVPDVTPRERYALVACLVALVGAGLWPSAVTETWAIRAWHESREIGHHHLESAH